MSIGCRDSACEMSFWTTNSRKGKMETFGSNSGAHDTRPPSGTDNSRLWGAGLWWRGKKSLADFRLRDIKLAVTTPVVYVLCVVHA